MSNDKKMLLVILNLNEFICLLTNVHQHLFSKRIKHIVNQPTRTRKFKLNLLMNEKL